MWSVKENSVSFDDFKDKKVVLISDEAHHLSASTKICIAQGMYLQTKEC